MILTISKVSGKTFMVDDRTKPGSPIVGYGRSFREAIGDYFHNNQTELADKFGIKFAVDESAKPAETDRRRRELAKR
jgi:hypothetical protein